MTTQQRGGDGAEEAYNRFNFNILTPFYQLINTFLNENFEIKEEVTKELEAMKLVKKRISGSEFEQATLNLYIWELKSNLKEYKEEGGSIALRNDQEHILLVSDNWCLSHFFRFHHIQPFWALEPFRKGGVFLGPFYFRLFFCYNSRSVSCACLCAYTRKLILEPYKVERYNTTNQKDIWLCYIQRRTGIMQIETSFTMWL